MSRRHLLRWNTVLVVMPVALAHTLAWLVFHQRGWVTAAENGAIENAQVAALVVATALFLLTSRARSASIERVFFAALALLCTSFVLREVDVEKLNLNPVLTWLGSGVGKDLWLSIVWLGLLLLMAKRAHSTWLFFLCWLQTPTACALVLGGLFYLLGAPFDNHWVELPYAVAEAYEEIAEVTACFFILLSSFLSAAPLAHRLQAKRRGVASAERGSEEEWGITR